MCPEPCAFPFILNFIYLFRIVSDHHHILHLLRCRNCVVSDGSESSPSPPQQAASPPVSAALILLLSSLLKLPRLLPATPPHPSLLLRPSSPLLQIRSPDPGENLSGFLFLKSPSSLYSSDQSTVDSERPKKGRARPFNNRRSAGLP